jgi:hypothetical protein
VCLLSWKESKSRVEIKPGDILTYIEMLLKLRISQEEIGSILKKIGTEYDA